MKLALAGALLAVALPQTVKPATPAPMTLAESAALSDAALVGRVFQLVKDSPALAGEDLPQADDVIAVVRPTGRPTEIFDHRRPGFHDLGLALRARDTGVAGLCAATTLTIVFRPTPLPKTMADDRGWQMPPLSSLPLYRPGAPSLSANDQQMLSNDPDALPWELRRKTKYVPVAPAKRCEDRNWPSTRTIDAPSAELVNLGLKLFAQVKKLPANSPTICPENRNFISRRKCLQTFRRAAPSDIVYVDKCEDQTEGPLCIYLQSKLTEHGGGLATWWESRIVYSAGEQPTVRITHFEMSGGIA